MSMFTGSPARTSAVPTLGVQLAAMHAFYGASSVEAMQAPMARVRNAVYEPLQIPTDPLDRLPDAGNCKDVKEDVRESAYEQLSDMGWRVASQYRLGETGVLGRAGITRIARLLPEIGRERIIDHEIAAQLHRYALERSAHRKTVVGAIVGGAFFVSGGSGLITGGEFNPLYIGSCLGTIFSLIYAVGYHLQAQSLHEEVTFDIELLRHREGKPKRPSFG